jgi:hypothetical protein
LSRRERRKNIKGWEMREDSMVGIGIGIAIWIGIGIEEGEQFPRGKGKGEKLAAEREIVVHI